VGKLIIRRPVSVMAIMTEKFREQMIRESEKTLKIIEEDLKKIETESVKYIASISLQNPQQASALTQQMEAEKQRLKANRAQLEAKIAELEGIQDGTEVPFQSFDGFVEVSIGDNLYDKLGKAVIVIKDWNVVEIRDV